MQLIWSPASLRTGLVQRPVRTSPKHGIESWCSDSVLRYRCFHMRSTSVSSNGAATLSPVGLEDGERNASSLGVDPIRPIHPDPGSLESDLLQHHSHRHPSLATLMVSCPDQKGVIAALAQLLFGMGCNILESDQYTDTSEGMYFQRIHFDFSEIVVGNANTAVLEAAVADLARRFDMTWKIFYDSNVKRVAIFVSKMDHCLWDLLIRHQAGELRCSIPVIVSNHPDLESVATSFGIKYCCFPLLDRSPEAKAKQESEIEALLEEEKIDLLVLARYMQVFSPDFCSRHCFQTVNIHHSFLPAFEGARPYHRAHERGVKVIGATAHYATSQLDAGPIIEQDVTRITHRDSVEDMIRKGRDLERLVLARAVRWVLRDRVMVYNNKTIVFYD
eukprot:jgi/Botrbrau1/5281/Bobra.0391s0002.1